LFGDVRAITAGLTSMSLVLSCLVSVYTSIVVLAFVVTTFLFLIYERLVTKREKTKNAALKVVSSMFPSSVQEKVLRGVQDGIQRNSDEENLIASFYPATTVLFGTKRCVHMDKEPNILPYVSLLFFLVY
jgi:hypothetical protein